MKIVYKAVNDQGKAVRGLVEAKDQQEAAVFLRKQDLFPITLKEYNPSRSLKSLFIRKSASTDLVFFTRQLSSMLSSGLTLMQALQILRGQVQNPAMAEVVNGLIASIEEGKSFSLAIAKYPQVFSPIYVSLIQAAESAGLLDKILLRLADNLEKQQKLKGMIKSALMYPIIVIILMVAVMTIMMIFVVPQLTVLYENLDIPLPLPTQIVIGLSNATINFWPFVLGGVIFFVYYFRKWKKTPRGMKIIDALILRMPIFGKLATQSIMVEFGRTFGLLVGTGSLVVESLNQSADVVGNIYYRNAIKEVGKKVEKVVTIGDAMLAEPLFPPIIVEMTKIGEQTGKLDDSLTRVSEYFEREVEQTVKALTTALEPFIMIILALGVGFLVISVITPIYNLISQIQ
ncbi:MAG: type II secretion system F family protein [Candidatus Levybacteria bacterium]|nr:type II secretion system F family protein [Candidatus Levybacteria bacterium]